MDFKSFFNAAFSEIASSISGIKKEYASASVKEMHGIKEQIPAKQSNHPQPDTIDTPQIKEEIEAAWREKEIIDAENRCAREKKIAEEIEQAWDEKEMSEDDYSAYGVQDDEISGNDDINDADNIVRIRLNTAASGHLKSNLEALCNKYPGIREMQAKYKLFTILMNEFRDGVPKNIYVRYMPSERSDNATEKYVSNLAIRPELTPDDYLRGLLPEDTTLLFRGHLKERSFIVDDISDAANTDRLDFEVYASIIPRYNISEVKCNYFSELLKRAKSLARNDRYQNEEIINADSAGDNSGEEVEENDAPEIDNTDLEYKDRFVFIRLNNAENERRNRLRISADKLCKKYHNIRKLQTENRLQTILDNEFRDGFSKEVFIRNLTFQKDERDIPVLAIRPRLVPGDYLHELLPEGTTLIFRGHVQGREFVVDDIYDAADTDQLDFEAAASIIPRNNPEDVKYNFLYEILDKAESLTKYTGERLEEWKQYLRWYRQICVRQVYGIKYYRFYYDNAKKQIVFWLVCKDKEYFNSNRKYLKRDIQVFDNDYSKDEWIFDFAVNDDGKKRYSRSIELGRFRGIKESYYLKDNDADPDELFDEAIGFDDEEDEPSADVKSTSNLLLTEEDVLKAFDKPYIVKVAYDLPRDIKDRLQDQEFLNEEDEQAFVEEYYLSDISPNGFLALSAVGDLALIKRFERAIISLERDECYSPNLAAWLFNIDQARLPIDNEVVEIEHWLNPDIASNENQKEAVRKMIAAPDICLIQGPPGTGKTTVIAEAIFQLVVRGNRVLVASQSNDAVDNALERLADRPEIRAIRLGQKSRRKKNAELSKRKFSEDEALKYYYNSLSASIRDKWLDQWKRLEKQRLECRKDAVDLQNYHKDISEYQAVRNDLIRQVQELQRNADTVRQQIRQVNQQNAMILDTQQKAHSFATIVNGVSEAKLFLTEKQLQMLEGILNPIIKEAQESGILLTLHELDVANQGTENCCEFIRILLSKLPVLSGICAKLRECDQRSVRNTSSLEILESRREEIRGQMADAVEADDMEKLALLRKQLNEVKVQIEEAKGHGSAVTLTSTEKLTLTEPLSALIAAGNTDGTLGKLEDIVLRAKEKLHESVEKITVDADRMTLADITELEEKSKATESQLAARKQQLKDADTEYESHRSLLKTLADKYNIMSDDITAINSAIEGTLQDIEKTLSDSAPIRRQWEDVMTQFNERLNDEKAFISDQKYYQPIYVNSCNVVGISCTDNMRALTDNGYEEFDVVIIDEVSKATPPELLIPLMKARKAILVGDHRQLPPMFKEHEHSYNDIISDRDSIPEELRDLMTTANFRRFRKMVTSSLFKEYFERADASIRHPLLVQYRMHSDIMRVINRFYENRLLNGWNAEQETQKKAHGLHVKGIDGSDLIIPSRHAYWFDSSSLPSGKRIYDSKSNPATKDEGGTSSYNVLEQYMIIELLKRMADSWREQYKKDKKKKEVGIISFYQAQVNRIRELFREEKRNGFDFSPLDVDINTVDRFQGKEKHVVIASLVTNSSKGWASKHVITFERINVAFSRAQQLLVIVGAKHTYEKQVIELPNMDNTGTSTVAAYQNIMEEMHRNGCFKGSENLITPEIETEIMKAYQGGEDE